MKFALLLIVGAMLAVGLAACGDDDNGGTTATEATTAEGAASGEAAEESGDEGGSEVSSSEADTVVNATLGEFYIKLDSKKVDAGNIEFKATDEGQLEHEFVVIKTDTPADKLPLADGDVDEEAAGEVPGEIPGIQPGATEEVTLTLDPGKYVIICNLPGHYKAGQYTTLTVR
jgi:uncharacterized cupredoxin-like copper-binding protein